MKQLEWHQKNHVARRLLAVIGVVALLFSGSGMRAAARGSSWPAQPEPKGLLAACLGEIQARSFDQSPTGEISFVGIEPGNPIPQPVALPESASAEQAARSYLSVCGSLFGLSDQASDLTLKQAAQPISSQEGQERSVLRFQQTFKGIPVFAGELVVQLDEMNKIILINGEILPGIKVDTQPAVDASAAQQEALQAVAGEHQLGSDELTVTSPELWVYNPVLIKPGGGVSALVWRMEVASKELAPIRHLVLVDAHSGSIVLSLNQLDTAMNRRTYTANNTRHRPGTLVCNESNPTCSGGDTHAVNAHVYASDTYDFYSNYHGRDSVDNAGMTLISTVHYSTAYCNAFWDGSQMTYGDGCFIVVDDVVAHEITHGVTEYESNLIYAYESGAINESFSDVWGEFVDLVNGRGNDVPGVRWLMGEDTSMGAIRNMQDPTTMGDPDRMSSPYYYHGSHDNGGVHTNSGVNNKAAYLMTDGDTFKGYTVTGLGLEKVARIYYEAQTNILTSGSDYGDLYNALYQACSNLVGSGGITADDCQQVRNATLATEMNYGPTPPANDDFDNAVEIASLDYTADQDASAATTAADDPIFTCVSGKKYNTVWYRYTASQAENLTIDTFGSNYDTILAVWTGARGSLASVGCNDDAVVLQSALQIAATEGETYYIEIADFSGSGGQLTLNVSRRTCYTLTTGVNPGGSGSVNANPAPNCAGSQYTSGTLVQLTATPNRGYTFANWSGDASGSSNPVPVIMDAAKSVTANFTRQAPGAFDKITPADGTADSHIRTTLSWGASSGARRYEVCIDTTDNDTCDSSWINVYLNLSKTIRRLSIGGTYYWQVRAIGRFATTYANGGAWWSFTTTTTIAQ